MDSCTAQSVRERYDRSYNGQKVISIERGHVSAGEHKVSPIVTGSTAAAAMASKSWRSFPLNITDIWTMMYNNSQ